MILALLQEVIQYHRPTVEIQEGASAEAEAEVEVQVVEVVVAVVAQEVPAVPDSKVNPA